MKRKGITAFLVACIIVASVFFTSCGNSAPKGPEELTSSNIGVPLKPLDTITSAAEVKKGGTYSATFLEIHPGKVTADILTYDRYSMEDIKALQPGDEILHCNEIISIESVEEQPNQIIYINGGIETGGFELREEEGAYRTVSLDDYPDYYSVGTIELPISEDIVFEDSSAEPGADVFVLSGPDVADAITDSDLPFTVYNTKITVSNGEISKISRIWVP